MQGDQAGLTLGSVLAGGRCSLALGPLAALGSESFGNRHDGLAGGSVDEASGHGRSTDRLAAGIEEDVDQRFPGGPGVGQREQLRARRLGEHVRANAGQEAFDSTRRDSTPSSISNALPAMRINPARRPSG